ncbi:class I SAM-dependent methyltransferase [Methylobacterium sp. WL103]|uniref:class I SAM-dependent methyltransferase n=1 Tax=Methylobacterium sp. WL103 TaxID=2603891 RepID=UPI0011CBFBA0|nr:class I SAM-dependent methyltransferase [Methylobacterium sp. WL103]TXN04133.1 class I SAM-dependent methyltransferase [Methylobacterium sp. WL103]
MNASIEIRTTEKPAFPMPASIKDTYKSVDPRVALHDHMATSNITAYYQVGASALTIIQTSIALGCMPAPEQILDFACGAGRVTRWLRAAYPESTVSGSDLREADIDFHRKILGTNMWKSEERISNIKPPNKYDLIWVGSLLSHLSEQDALAAMHAFMNWLKPNGILVVSFHGRRAQLGQTMRQARYISDSKFKLIEQDYFEKGYGYAPYDNQPTLGMSLIKPNWFFMLAESKMAWKILGVFEAAWADHHDVCTIQNKPVCVPI